MADKNIGKITQVIGAVLDLKFSEGYLPEINDAVEITRKDGAEGCISTGQRFVFIRGIIKIKYWHCNFSFITVPFLTLITGTVLLFFRFPFLCR